MANRNEKKKNPESVLQSLPTNADMVKEVENKLFIFVKKNKNSLKLQ